MPVTKLESGGLTYVHTHRGETATEIAESLTPYIGRVMNASLPNNYGHYARYRVTLLAVNAEMVTVEEMRSGIVRAFNAFDIFGSQCTTVEREPTDI
jgi:hypothetical protein